MIEALRLARKIERYQNFLIDAWGKEKFDIIIVANKAAVVGVVEASKNKKISFNEAAEILIDEIELDNSLNNAQKSAIKTSIVIAAFRLQTNS